MRILRFCDANGAALFGALEACGTRARPLPDFRWGRPGRAAEPVKIAAQLPFVPPAVLGIGLNYRRH